MNKENKQLKERFNTIFNALNKGAKTLKEWEIFLQYCIEAALTTEQAKEAPCWWQHTEEDIFSALLGVNDTEELTAYIKKLSASLYVNKEDEKNA